MALDSSGNQAIDFVWGNNPLKPDTDRAESIADITATVYGASPDAPSGGNQSFNVSNIVGITVGDTVEVTGALPYSLNTSYVVETIYPSSPNGGSLVTTTPNGVFGNWSPTVIPTLSKSASDNFGGGLGDKGWSKTTKAKSVKLDPALDGHNIATEYWNNFPNYTPNAGFIPQELWSYNLAPNGSLKVMITPDWQEDFANSYPSGYMINLSDSVVTNSAKYTELLSYIASDAVIGKSTDAFVFEFNDQYGFTRTVNIPAGTVVGADTEISMYGGANTATLTVYTGPIATDGPMVWNSAFGANNAFDLVLGAGVNKTLIYKGVAGVDFSQTQEVSTGMYGDAYSHLTISPMYGQQLPAEILALNTTDLAGAIAGFGNISTTDMQGYFNKRVTFPMSDAINYYTSDMYGGSITNIRLIGTEATTAMGGSMTQYVQGTTLYIVK